MEIDYDQIHSEVLLKSKSYNFINEQINLNGIIKIKKTKLDFFSFFLKMIISQQISDNLAGKIWKKFCSILNSQNPTIQKISNKKHLLYCVSNLKISKRKVEKEFVSMASMNCWIYEEDIGKMCSFLISSDGERISGQTIPVDGNAIRLD